MTEFGYGKSSGIDHVPPVAERDISGTSLQDVAEIHERAAARWPIPINYREGDPEYMLLIAQRHAYVLGRLDAVQARENVVNG